VLFRSYAWPGNVRELRNAVERMLLKAGGAKLGLEHVPSDLRLG
jgi:DNA-binding NtrC family response regulator